MDKDGSRNTRSLHEARFMASRRAGRVIMNVQRKIPFFVSTKPKRTEQPFCWLHVFDLVLVQRPLLIPPNPLNRPRYGKIESF